MPLDNLDDYSPTLVEAGGGGSPPLMAGSGGASGTASTPPSNEPLPGASGAGGSGGSLGSAGSNAGGAASGAGGSNGTGGSGAAGSNGNGSGSGSAGAGQPDAGTSPTDPEDPPPEDPEEPALCADGELEGPDDDCFFLDARTQNFFAARSACQARGSGWDLASIRSPEASALLGDTLTFEGWLVGSDVQSEGNWAWLDDGTPFWQGGTGGTPVAGTYANWNATEPNGGGTTNCLRALPRSAGSANPDAPWADLACTDLRGGICRGPQR
ncbi:MAG TPA: C-type lectin domain-containing protein [Polyangiaceae bacterium]|nr:C-type lectin domain-containing protein [Polyangiaceae bacterium]